MKFTIQLRNHNVYVAWKFHSNWMLETLKKLWVSQKYFIKILTFSKFQIFLRNTYNFQLFSILCDRTHVWDATHTFKIFLGSKPTLLGFFKLCLSKTHKISLFWKTTYSNYLKFTTSMHNTYIMHILQNPLKLRFLAKNL